MRACPTCGADVSPEARFCAQCGTPLEGACRRCGAEIPPGSRFCPACGAPVGEPARPGEERKLVTVLFADVAGSTALGEQLDPERLKDVMGAYFEAMRGEIEAEGGTVEKFIGDAVMAVFGVPAAHEDDPTRALRAAVRMRRELDRLNTALQADYGVTLAMRIGVNTGEVVAATVPRLGEGMVTGDAVNVAARLEQNAESGQILVSERTAMASRRVRLQAHPVAWLETREVGKLTLKGKEEAVRAFELDEVAAPEAEGPHLVPMVGREREMDLLRSVYERVESEGRPSLLTVYGEAGVGKTRLVEEFLARVAVQPNPPLIAAGRCLPYGEGVTYWPFGELLKGHTGVLDSDSPEEALGKIERSVTDLLAGLEANPAAVTRSLALTVSLRGPGEPPAGDDPRRADRDLRDAWRTFLSALAMRSPVIVVVEDIHWADPAILDLLEELADRALGPVLFLCPARPELTGRRPGWGGGRWNFSAALLEPLTASDSGRLLDHLLGDEVVPPLVRVRMLERAGGNPFFLGEIVRHVIDTRARVARDEGALASEDVWDVDIPDTVQGVLAARLDLLSPSEKRVLQYAAVVGKQFWSGPLARLMGPGQDGDVEDALARLEERGLVHGTLASSVEGEREYTFGHILTRDVTYETLRRRERATAHAEVAAWIEERTGERAREFAELLAHHYGEAHRGILEDPRRDPEVIERLRERAFAFALLAADEARSKLAVDQAIRFAEQALAVSSGSEERAGALEVLGLSYFHDYRGDLAWECLREAIDLQAPGGRPPPEPAARARVARLCAEALELATRGRGTMRTRLVKEEAEPYLDLGLSAAGETDSEERAWILVARSFWPYAFRTFELDDESVDAARAIGEEATAMALRLGRPDLASAGLDGVCSSYHLMGRYTEMEGPLRRRLDLVDSLSDPYELGDVHAFAAWWAMDTGRYRQALEFADRGFELASAGSPVMALYCVDFRTQARARLGDWDGALADVGLAEEMLGERRETPPGFAAVHPGVAAFIHEVQGDQGTANRYVQLIRWLQRAEERPDMSRTLWLMRVLLRRGEFSEARSLLQDPRDVAVPQHLSEMLEGWCEWIGLSEAWDELPRLLQAARPFAETAGLLALPAYLDRLEGRAAIAAGERERGVALLEAAAETFRRCESGWEAAVTGLETAEALTGGRPEDREVARARVAAAKPVFDRLRSVRELLRVGQLAERMG